MNKWTVNIEGKKYLTVCLTGKDSSNLCVKTTPKQGGLLKGIERFVKKNRELFLKKSLIRVKIADEDVKFRKTR